MAHDFFSMAILSELLLCQHVRILVKGCELSTACKTTSGKPNQKKMWFGPVTDWIDRKVIGFIEIITHIQKSIKQY